MILRRMQLLPPVLIIENETEMGMIRDKLECHFVATVFNSLRLRQSPPEQQMADESRILNCHTRYIVNNIVY